MSRLLKSAVFFLLLPTALIVGLLYAFQDNLIFPAPTIDVNTIGTGNFKRVSISTPDGETLFALERTTKSAKGWILVFHGNGDAAILQQRKGEMLIDAGFNVLLVEYRGYPGSTGTPSEAGLITDGKSAFDFVKDQSRAENDGSKMLPIGVYAHSLGTGVAVHLANERKVAALVLEAPFDSLLAVAQRRLPLLPLRGLLNHPFRSDKIVGNLNIPILIVHGDNDQVIPIDHGRALANKAGDNARFVLVEGAGHNNLDRHGTIQRAVGFFTDQFAN